MQIHHFATPLLLAAAALAQQAIVPSYAATGRPTSSAFYTANVFYSTSSATVPHDSHTQLIYDVTDVGLPVALWNSLQVRRPSSNSANTSLGNGNPAMTTTGTIQMALSPTAYSAMTNNFATNLGANPITVFSGTISLPVANGQSTWPAAWQAPLMFSGPFVFAAGGNKSLVVDILQTGNSATSGWYLEAQQPLAGARANNGPTASTCKFSTGNYNSGIGYTLPRLGGTWSCTYSSVLPNATGFAWIGVNGIGGSFNGLPLPIDLGPLGAPGCFVQASAEIVVPVTASATGSASWPAPLTIPNDPALGNASFYDHSVFVDPLANSWGVVVGWSSKWTIGNNKGAPAAMLSTTGASALNATGTLALETGVTLQFNP